MKIIKINESQKKRLFEAYQQDFSFEQLAMIADSAFASGTDGSELQIRYCTKYLGYPFSMGSSRAVYTLSDNFVLKLAYGRMYRAGIDQNRVEYNIYNQLSSPLLPRIFHHDKNFTFLVSESVIPCKAVDFEKLLGMPFYETYTQNSSKINDVDSLYGGDYEVGYNKYFDNLKGKGQTENMNFSVILSYLNNKYVRFDTSYDPNIEEAIKNNSWLTELRNLVQKTRISDLGQIDNFGIVNRNGKPMIVILDTGFNFDVLLKHYTK